MTSTITERCFYHIYPLGMAGAPKDNNFSSPSGSFLKNLTVQIPHLLELGFNGVYIGPLFESTSHGYDTLDYFYVDRRLGTNEDLKNLIRAYHDNGIVVILDGVLNHTGRHFFAFKDLQEKGSASKYGNWFKDIDFSQTSPLGDGFSYQGWSGHYDLVKLNTRDPQARQHLFDGVAFWIREFDIDGLRLDAADVLDPDFLDELSGFAKSQKPGFWLMGEVVHGDYRNWVAQGRLDSVTNYELYKGLWSSFNDKNFFELAWTLNRQFGDQGIYRNFQLYTFVDNHDVNRVASVLTNSRHLYPLYGLLFTLPGVPSVYYGSEWGIRGRRTDHGDHELRPPIAPEAFTTGWVRDFSPEVCPSDEIQSDDLAQAIARFIHIRKTYPALQAGSWEQVFLSHEQLVFQRKLGDQEVLVVVNSDDRAVELGFPVAVGSCWKDVLNEGWTGNGADGNLTCPIDPLWMRILVRD